MAMQSTPFRVIVQCERDADHFPPCVHEAHVHVGSVPRLGGPDMHGWAELVWHTDHDEGEDES